MSRRSPKTLRNKTGMPISDASSTGRSSDGAENRGLMVFLLCLFLIGLTWFVFGRTINYDFICYDDNAYVYENPEVARGVSWKSAKWALTHRDLLLWTPLTTISHMVDSEIYGLSPAGHHLTNVALHMAAVVLLFLALREMTGAMWCSAFAAAVFAIHPLRVESVTWISERKDVLNGFFFALALCAYVRYTRSPFSLLRYLSVVFCFVLGLLSKQMLVTLPFVLLLLDYWPLGRVREKEGGVFILPAKIILEKIPMLLISVVSVAQVYWGPAPGVDKPLVHPFFLRMCNALVSYLVYAAKTSWPTQLAVLYPYPAAIPVWQTSLSALLLLAVTCGVFAARRKVPALLIGWLWYLGMLVPVIGLVQVGNEARADRYTYLPQIGLCIMVAWGVAAVSTHWKFRREILGVAAGTSILALAWLSVIQASYWKESVSLWQRTIACTPPNALAHSYLGDALLLQGRYDEAIPEFQKALAIMPRLADAENYYGMALMQKNDVDGALLHFQKALEINPRNVDAQANLAIALTQKGDLDGAIVHFQKALEARPTRPDAYTNLGNVYLQKGQTDDAIALYRRAIEVDPAFADAYGNLGNAQLQKGLPREALLSLQKALRLSPQNATTLNNIARVMATNPDASVRDGNKAVVIAVQANEISGGDDPAILDTLSSAYAEAGRFPEAIETARRAQELASNTGREELAKNIGAHLALYRNNMPLRISPKKPAGQ